MVTRVSLRAPMARLFRISSALFALLLIVARASDARAEEPPVQMGRIPPIWVAPSGAVVLGPSLKYTTTDSYFSDPPEVKQEKLDRNTGAFGPEVKLRLDLDVLLVYGDGFWNALPKGDLGFIARGGVILGRGLGGRTTTKLTEYRGSTTDGYTRTETYAVHLNKEVPLIYGLALGGGVYGMRAIDAVDITGDYGASGYVPVHIHRDALLMKTVEAGFGLVGGQVDVFAGPIYDFTKHTPGLRLNLTYAIPAGSIPIYFGLRLEHFFGSDVGFGTLAHFAIGLGLPGLGVSTSN